MPGNSLIFKDAEKARNSITKQQNEEIAKLYEQWAKEIADRAEWYRKKTTSSSVLSEKQMKELEKMLRASSQQIANEVHGLIKQNIYVVADSIVQANTKWLASLGFDQSSVSAAFSSVPDKIVRKMVTGQIYESGWSLSKRIWGDNEATLKELYKIVAGGMAKNQSIYEIAKDLSKFVDPKAKKLWNLTDKDGRKIYPKQVEYNSQRLARTLVQHGYQQGFIEVTKDNPFIKEYIWRSNGSRVCEICLARDGQHYKKDQLPMDHPNGMCTMVPDVSKTLTQDLESWLNEPDGTYPEIDKFAEQFGYKSNVSVPKKTGREKYDMKKVEEDFEFYIAGGYSSFKDAVSKQTYEYVKENMKGTTKPLYRVEDARYTYDTIDVGDKFSFKDDIRSFTRSFNYAGKMINEGLEEDFFENPIVFETVGRVEHFDTSKYAEGYYENQYESMVGGEFEVVDIVERMINGFITDVVKIKAVKKKK